MTYSVRPYPIGRPSTWCVGVHAPMIIKNTIAAVALLAACSVNGTIVLKEEGPGGPNTFRVAALHFSAENAEVNNRADGQRLLERNFERTARLVRIAARAGAKVVLTPEYGNIGGFLGSWEPPDVAVHLPEAPTKGPLWYEDTATYLKRYARLAVELDVYIVTHLIEEENGAYYNALAALAPDGRLVASYRKRARWLAEMFTLAKGDKAASFDTPYGRFGLLVCLDAVTPSSWLPLVNEHDVDFILVASRWAQTPITGRMAMKVLAAASRRPVLWANQRGLPFASGAGLMRPWDADTTMGIFGPRGVLVANLPYGDNRATLP